MGYAVVPKCIQAQHSCIVNYFATSYADVPSGTTRRCSQYCLSKIMLFLSSGESSNVELDKLYIAESPYVVSESGLRLNLEKHLKQEMTLEI